MTAGLASRGVGGPAVAAEDTAAPTQGKTRWRRALVSPWTLLALSALVFSYSITTIAKARPSQFGLLAGASPLYLVSILLVPCAFTLAVRRHSTLAGAAAVIMIIVVQRLPRSIATEVPMYSWTYKHLGVVDYIQTNGALARGTDIYNGWPGLFAVTAWFSDLTKIHPIYIAHWFTPVFHVALAGLVFGAARAWGLNVLQALTACFLVTTLNWVEQDYYSPQATTLLLTVAILMLLGLARQRRLGVVLVLILFAAATITHQLTPFWVLLAAGLLVVGRRLRPWWIVLPMAAILIGFFLVNFDITRQYGSLFSLDVVHNASTNNVGPGVFGQVLTSTVMRTLSISMWLSTAAVLLTRLRRRQPMWALGVLALSPLLILGGQGYGGEAVFRVFLYSLLGCSIVLAPGLVAALRARRTRFVTGLVTAVIATAMSAQCYFGSWFTNLLRKDQVSAASIVLQTGDFPAYVTPLVTAWPERSAGAYVKYARWNNKYDHSLMFDEGLVNRRFDTDADYDRFMSSIASRTDASTYLVLSAPMALYAGYFGIFPSDAVDNLSTRLSNDPRWKRIIDKPDVAVFLYRVPPK